MKCIMQCTLLFFLFTPGTGHCLDPGEWEYFDQGPLKPKTVCIDPSGRKWFVATE
ncbi:MAG: hypothetical protein ACYC9O_15990 [Candidatus Latescibacterota bacterium]